MAGLLSKGVTLSLEAEVLTNLQEVPELGGETESVEVTVLSDEAHMYINGIKSYGDSVDFKFLYEKAQFDELAALGNVEKQWMVTLPDKTTVSFEGMGSVRLDAISVNSPLTYTLSIKPTSAMVFGTAAA